MDNLANASNVHYTRQGYGSRTSQEKLRTFYFPFHVNKSNVSLNQTEYHPNIYPYNPVINFRSILLAILGHVVPNGRVGIK